MNLSFCFEVGKGPTMSIANFSPLWEITSGSSNGTWKRFSHLFTTVDAKDEALTDEEKACLLLEAMSTPETKEVVRTACQGSDGYELSSKALQQKYCKERTISGNIFRFSLVKKHSATILRILPISMRHEQTTLKASRTAMRMKLQIFWLLF